MNDIVIVFLEIFFSVVLGLLIANLIEWIMHKYILHISGRNKKSFWAFHFHEHHVIVKKNHFIDHHYHKFPFGNHPQGKEVWALILTSVVLIPLFFVLPYLTITFWYCVANYYFVHKKSHLNPEWAKQYLPWHYDHHMGKNPDANWCVTKPWFDYLFGTREFRPNSFYENNVLGLPYLPNFLLRFLPKPVTLGKVIS